MPIARRDQPKPDNEAPFFCCRSSLRQAMRRSASFSSGGGGGEARPSRIPVASRTTPPHNQLRRTGSMRLPSRSPAHEKEVWGVGSGSWGKRQQQLRRDNNKMSSPLSVASCRGSNTSIDTFALSTSRRPYEDEDDLCSEVSYNSTMSVDRTSSSRRFVLHCSGDAHAQQNGTPYLTPTQRTNLLNKDLRLKLKHALDEISLRDMEISRLTQECVELRMKHARLSASPDAAVDESPSSPTPPGIEKDSLDSSAHSELPGEPTPSVSAPVTPAACEPKPSRPDILDLGRRPPDNCLFNSLPVVIQMPVWSPEEAKPVIQQPKQDCTRTDQTATKSTKDCEIQTDARDDVEEQLKAAQEALIETKVQLSRVKKAAENSQAEVTLKFLKSAFYHLITDSSQGMSLATKSHWRAIQSILGFSPEECQAMDAAVAAGAFPGSTCTGGSTDLAAGGKGLWCLSIAKGRIRRVMSDSGSRLEELRSEETRLEVEERALRALIAEQTDERTNAILKKQHIDALHEYNEVKDAAQVVLGVLANHEQLTIKQMHLKVEHRYIGHNFLLGVLLGYE
ncbi:Hypothetical predicted protein [Cloeon dipterum]|uniref:DNA repair protein SWI5 homolog n=1 Tax=Cloeon dipterum TaxID=197152 RepID=A0A8S1BXJ2_9INSE|nr:Hypothetical predicted protein [Cloeon dipterum]